jgi:hypothetical protein
MPAAAVAVSGRARVVSSWPNLVERLVVGADDEIGCGVAPIAASQELEGRSATGRAVQGPSSAAPTVTAEMPVAFCTYFPSADIGNANL